MQDGGPLYLMRFAQTHESFRRAEIEALVAALNANRAVLAGKVRVEVVEYDVGSPFCLVRFRVEGGLSSRDDGGVWRTGGDGGREGTMLNDVARGFVARSIQSKGIYEVWGRARCVGSAMSALADGGMYESLHDDVRERSRHLWKRYQDDQEFTFRFSVDVFGGKRSEGEKREIINRFKYLQFGGRITMRGAEEEWTVFEKWVGASAEGAVRGPRGDGRGEKGEAAGEVAVAGRREEQMVGPRRLEQVFFGRRIGGSRRWLCEKHDLKQRPYISTTSMDAELALITANLALAAPGKLFLDPFCGTGGFMLAAAELGATGMGSDIDGRSFRGVQSGKRRDARGRAGVSCVQGLENGIGKNLKMYGLEGLMGDCFTADLVNSPLRSGGGRWLDGIICDPPYGVREGLKVLGTRKPDASTGKTSDLVEQKVVAGKMPHMMDGVVAHTLPGYIAPKKPYSFHRMLGDTLDFAARTLVDGGRLAFWMPSANFDEETGLEETTPIPSHALLELKHECVQRFNKWSRRLLVYERRPGDVDSQTKSAVQGFQGPPMPGTSADELNPFRRRYFQAFAEKADRPDG